MQWIFDFQLFLFDFDGLLVNTELLHYQAYMNVFSERGYDLGWGFSKFSALAHQSGSVFREAVYQEIPSLGPWEPIYAAKKERYRQLLGQGSLELMKGVEPLLRALEQAEIRRAIVTNSSRADLEFIAARIPLLKTIPHRIAREDYQNPKPDPECYLRAIELYGQPGDRIIGFEDSLRGLRALQGTPALPVLICADHHPLLEMAVEGGALHFASLSDVYSERS